MKFFIFYEIKFSFIIKNNNFHYMSNLEKILCFLADYKKNKSIFLLILLTNITINLNNVVS